MYVSVCVCVCHRTKRKSTINHSIRITHKNVFFYSLHRIRKAYALCASVDTRQRHKHKHAYKHIQIEQQSENKSAARMKQTFDDIKFNAPS